MLSLAVLAADSSGARDADSATARTPHVVIAKKGLVSYPTVTALLKAAEGFKKTGDLRATYVYDQTTGLKIFGHVAFYVKTKDATVPFMRKTDAERFSKSAGGKLVAFDDALKLAAADTTAAR